LLERADRLAHEGSWTELVRVRQESDRLKADLEHLKWVDLKLERRK
jgi:hypothetical protein